MGSGSGQMLCTITRKENLIVKKSILLVMALAMVFGAVSFAQAGWVTNVIDSPSPPFNEYRWYNQDFSWEHDGICCKHTTYVSQANLTIHAYDVDSASGEVDLIWALDRYAGINPDNTPIPGTNTWIQLGQLVGSSDNWSDTNFALPANLLDDVKYGLLVKIDIDSTNSSAIWAVTVGKSTIEANCVPLPGSLLLLGSGLAGLLGLRQRFFV